MDLLSTLIIKMDESKKKARGEARDARRKKRKAAADAKKSRQASEKPRGRRKRRSPEEARRLILDAAERVFSECGPDAAGLKVVAAEAGVTHGLVTHYFRTYEALVEATMERATTRARERIIESLASMQQPSPSVLLKSFFEIVEKEELGRLFAWLMLRGSTKNIDFFARRVQGPRKVADVIERRIRDADPPPERFDRDELDYLIVLSIAAGLGLGAGSGLLWEGLGREADTAQKHAFRDWLAELIDNRLRDVFGLAGAPRAGSED